MSDTKDVLVELTTIPQDKEKHKEKKRKFPISQANKLLSMKKSAWKLTDSKFKWNGVEIAKSN